MLTLVVHVYLIIPRGLAWSVEWPSQRTILFNYIYLDKFIILQRRKRRWKDKKQRKEAKKIAKGGYCRNILFIPVIVFLKIGYGPWKWMETSARVILNSPWWFSQSPPLLGWSGFLYVPKCEETYLTRICPLLRRRRLNWRCFFPLTLPGLCY